MDAPKKINFDQVFYLENFAVDVKRGEIWHKKSPNTRNSVEPKVMQVLILLVENKNNVISQESIFELVWPRSIFNPSSVQRCITLLRKALDDDAKQQRIIKTHHKRGYCLQISAHQPKATISHVKLGIPIIAAVLCFIAVILIINLNSSFDFDRVQLVPLSISEGNERSPNFSPSGTKLAYIKESFDNTFQIWIRESDTENHSKLYSSNKEIFSIDWTSDNQAIIFAESTLDGAQKSISPSMISIKRISVPSFSTPDSHRETVSTVTNIKNFSELKKIELTNNNSIYFIGTKKNDKTSNVFKFNLLTSQVEVINIQANDVVLSDMALSADSKKLAIVTHDETSKSFVSVYDVDTTEMTLWTEFDIKELWLNWHPTLDILLVNDGKKLTFLHRDGSENRVNFSTLSQIQDASFVNEKAISFTLDKLDVDIVSRKITNGNSNEIELVNTTKIEQYAKLSPDGRKLAYISSRKGYPQIFVRQNLEDRLVYANEKMMQNFNSLLWQDSTKFLALTNGQIIQVDIENNVINLLRKQVLAKNLISWDSDKRLAKVKIKESSGFAIVNYNPTAQEVVSTIPLDDNLDVFSMANGIPVAIEENKFYLLNTDGSKRFLFENNAVGKLVAWVGSASGAYLQTSSGNGSELWHYSLKKKQLEKIMNVQSNKVLLDISIDEKTALFRRTVHEQDIVMIEATE